MGSRYQAKVKRCMNGRHHFLLYLRACMGPHSHLEFETRENRPSTPQGNRTVETLRLKGAAVNISPVQVAQSRAYSQLGLVWTPKVPNTTAFPAQNEGHQLFLDLPKAQNDGPCTAHVLSIFGFWAILLGTFEVQVFIYLVP